MKWKPGIILTSFLVVAAWGYLVYNGDISTIWPMFGVANQLLATAALAIGNISHHEEQQENILRADHVYSDGVHAGDYRHRRDQNISVNYLPQRTFNGYLNSFLSAVMLVLVVVIVADCCVKWYAHMREHGWVSKMSVMERTMKEKEPAMELDI